MPIHPCTLPNGKSGFKWGQHGKCYADRKDAEAQATAIYASGWKEKLLSAIVLPKISLKAMLFKQANLDHAAHQAVTMQSRSLKRESKVNKAIGDCVLTYANLFGDSANTEALLTKGFNFISREIQEKVLFNVVRSLDDGKIFDAVIKSIPIDVVNILIGQEITPQMLLQDKTMLTKRLSVTSDEPILMPVILFIDSLASAISKISASNGAKKTSLSSMWTPSILKGDSASSASFTPVGLVQHSHIAGQMVRTNINPTEGQRQAGNYKKGAIKFAGMNISIENPAGSKRRPEWPPMNAHYGYVRGTEGADGDQVDCFLRPSTPVDWDGTAYVIDQAGPDGSFDEHKIMLGYDNQDQAVNSYLSHYPKGWKLGPVTAMSLDELRDWLSGDTTGPLAKDEGGSAPATSTTTGHVQSSSPTSGITAYGMIRNTLRRKLKMKEHGIWLNS